MKVGHDADVICPSLFFFQLRSRVCKVGDFAWNLPNFATSWYSKGGDTHKVCTHRMRSEVKKLFYGTLLLLLLWALPGCVFKRLKRRVH